MTLTAITLVRWWVLNVPPSLFNLGALLQLAHSRFLGNRHVLAVAAARWAGILSVNSLMSY